MSIEAFHSAVARLRNVADVQPGAIDASTLHGALTGAIQTVNPDYEPLTVVEAGGAGSNLVEFLALSVLADIFPVAPSSSEPSEPSRPGFDPSNVAAKLAYRARTLEVDVLLREQVRQPKQHATPVEGLVSLATAISLSGGASLPVVSPSSVNVYVSEQIMTQAEPIKRRLLENYAENAVARTNQSVLSTQLVTLQKDVLIRSMVTGFASRPPQAATLLQDVGLLMSALPSSLRPGEISLAWPAEENPMSITLSDETVVRAHDGVAKALEAYSKVSRDGKGLLIAGPADLPSPGYKAQRELGEAVSSIREALKIEVVKAIRPYLTDIVADVEQTVERIQKGKSLTGSNLEKGVRSLMMLFPEAPMGEDAGTFAHELGRKVARAVYRMERAEKPSM